MLGSYRLLLFRKSTGHDFAWPMDIGVFCTSIIHFKIVQEYHPMIPWKPGHSFPLDDRSRYTVSFGTSSHVLLNPEHLPILEQKHGHSDAIGSRDGFMNDYSTNSVTWRLLILWLSSYFLLQEITEMERIYIQMIIMKILIILTIWIVGFIYYKSYTIPLLDILNCLHW